MFQKRNELGQFIKGNVPFDRTGIPHTEETRIRLRKARIGRTPNKPKEMLGKKFNRLLVIRQNGYREKEYAWLCRCDCGKELIVGGYQLRSGKTKSCGCWTRDRMKEMNKRNSGKNHPNYGKPSYFVGKKRPGHSKRMLGEKNPNWKNGITPENIKSRNSEKMKLWKESIFARDNWVCQKCNLGSNKLRAHHIQNFSQYPELRVAVDNGITFCNECHKLFHRMYGIKNNTEKQIKRFLC